MHCGKSQKNGATLPKTNVMEGVTIEVPIITAEEKAQRRLEKKRFGRNVATKKTQKNILKQQYENFTAPSSEMLDKTFDMLQKLMSQLELLKEKLSHEDAEEGPNYALMAFLSLSSDSKKMYFLVVTDDYSRFTWVFFLATKDETSVILKSFKTRIENLVDHKVKVIICDNRTELKNKEMNQFCKMNGILKQFSIARTPQQNGVAERRNRTLVEAARTMLADSKLPTTFCAKAVNTACYVQNRVLVVKPHNKTPYELFHGRTPTLSFMIPFGCPVTILNTIDHLDKFDDNADEGFFIGYSLNSKAFRVFNSRTKIVEENLHIKFSESTPNVVGSGPDWLFDIDALTRTMNYEPIVAST
nr:ribonuclease H-like domain-containing protein [Tanacetum cinerariifolium]